MDTLTDLKIRASFDDELIELLRAAKAGKLRHVVNGDLQSMAEAFVMKVYRAGQQNAK